MYTVEVLGMRWICHRGEKYLEILAMVPFKIIPLSPPKWIIWKSKEENWPIDASAI